MTEFFSSGFEHSITLSHRTGDPRVINVGALINSTRVFEPLAKNRAEISVGNRSGRVLCEYLVIWVTYISHNF